MHYYLDDGLTRTERTRKREEEIISIIKAYWRKHNYSPTIREIAKKASVSSTSTILKYLNRLQEKGLIEWNGVSRTIRISEPVAD